MRCVKALSYLTPTNTCLNPNSHARCFDTGASDSSSPIIPSSTSFPYHPHLPSPGPSGPHLSPTFPQSNSFFPSFLFTSLCASHIHLPSPSLPSVRGSFPGLLIQSRKSSAQCQQGYNFEKRERNWDISDCWVLEGEGG